MKSTQFQVLIDLNWILKSHSVKDYFQNVQISLFLFLLPVRTQAYFTE